MIDRLKPRLWLIALLGAAFVLLIILPPFLPVFFVQLMGQSLIYGIVATSLDILVGYSGMPSLGHGGYFAVGAYTTAILSTRYGAGFALTLPSSIFMAVVLSAFLGLLVLRATWVYFLMITLAFAMCIWGLIDQWVSFTRGENGIRGIMRPSLGLSADLTDTVTFYYFILFFFLLCMTLMVLFIRSPFGKTLVGIRDSPTRMSTLGCNIWLHKYLAFIIAAAFAGLAGCLFAYFNQFVGPDDANLETCMEFFLMVSIGGQGTLIGPNIGAFLITFLKNLLSIYTERWLMVLAVIYILCAKYTPTGIIGFVKKVLRKYGYQSAF